MKHDHEPNIGGDCGQSADSADNLRTRIIDDGGPAFPASPTYGPNGDLYRPADIGCEGMTLRDWFAGQALQGRAHRLGNPHDARAILAQDCYDIADAMLEARKGGAK